MPRREASAPVDVAGRVDRFRKKYAGNVKAPEKAAGKPAEQPAEPAPEKAPS